MIRRKEVIQIKKDFSKVNRMLNTIVGCCVGVFVVHGLYVFSDYRKHPDLYAMQSAPWYSSILTYGIFTAVMVVLALIIKGLITHKKSKN